MSKVQNFMFKMSKVQNFISVYCSDIFIESDALNAKEKMDGNMFRGRRLTIHFAMHKTTTIPEKNATNGTHICEDKIPEIHFKDSTGGERKTSSSDSENPEFKSCSDELKIEATDDVLERQEVFLTKDDLYSNFTMNPKNKTSDSDSYSSPFEFGFSIPLSKSFEN